MVFVFVSLQSFRIREKETVEEYLKKNIFKMSADSDIENFSENDDYDYDYPGK